MSSPVPPPATHPRVSQDDNTASIVGSVLGITIVAIGKLFWSALLELEHMSSLYIHIHPLCRAVGAGAAGAAAAGPMFGAQKNIYIYI